MPPNLVFALSNRRQFVLSERNISSVRDLTTICIYREEISPFETCAFEGGFPEVMPTITANCRCGGDKAVWVALPKLAQAHSRCVLKGTKSPQIKIPFSELWHTL